MISSWIYQGRPINLEQTENYVGSMNKYFDTKQKFDEFAKVISQ